MSFRAAMAARITVLNASIRCERVSPPRGLASTLPVVLTASTQRTALAADTPSRLAAARRDIPAETAATRRERRSMDSVFPMHAGLLPSPHDQSYLARV